MNQKLGGNLLSASSAVIWATGFPATAILFQTWDPVLLTPLRLTFATLTITLLVIAMGRGREFALVPWKKAFLVGAPTIGISTTLMVWGIGLSDPVAASIIATCMPLTSAILGLLWGKEKIGWPLALGLALAIPGGVLAASANFNSDVGFKGGEFLLIGAQLLFVTYSRLAITVLHGVPDMVKASATMGAAVLFLLPVAALSLSLGWSDLRYEFSLQSILLFAWMGGIAGGVSLVMWLTSARLLGVTISAMHQNTVPFYVMVVMVLLGGSFYIEQLLGAVLVVAGALIAQFAGPLMRRKTV